MRCQATSGLSAGRCLYPSTPSASPARLLTQATVLIHLAAALAVGAFCVDRMQPVGAGGDLDVELTDVGVNDDEALIDQQ
jgi:hypothetical protein